MSPQSSSARDLSRDSAEADRLLVDQCITGLQAAWSRLYTLCEKDLRRTIELTLMQLGVQLTELDELLALIWYQLVEDGARRLDTFDPHRGRLLPFVCGMARNITRRYLRSERRRRLREALVSRQAPSVQLDDQVFLDIEKFAETLTNREKDYFDQCLDSPEEPADAGYSETNLRKLRSRVKNKFVKFFDCDGYIGCDD